MIQVLVAVIVLGFVLWLVETYVPMSPPFKMLVRVIVVVMIIIAIAKWAGLW